MFFYNWCLCVCVCVCVCVCACGCVLWWCVGCVWAAVCVCVCVCGCVCVCVSVRVCVFRGQLCSVVICQMSAAARQRRRVQRSRVCRPEKTGPCAAHTPQSPG